jgi:thimet oligopeptidase
MLFDYTTVTADSVGQVVKDAIATGDALLDRVVAVDDADRTLENTVVPFDRIGALANDTYGQGPFMARVHPDAAVREAASAAEAELDQWLTSIAFRRDLYEAVEGYAATDAAAALDGEEARLLAFVRRDFRRAGHDLDADDRAELEELQSRLIDLGVAFARNLDAYTDAIEVTREDLDGMPDAWIDRLAPGEAEGTYRVSLDYPDYIPFTEQAHRRDLREQLAFKFSNKARDENLPILEEAFRIRRRIAALFGLPSWADHALEVKMAKTLDRLDDFYDDLVPPLQEKAAEEQADLEAHHDHDHVERWDFRYLHTAIRKERFGIDQNEVAEYFPLGQVLDGMLDITSEVFGLTYRELDGVPVWHQDVTAWEVTDSASGDLIGHFYLDLHPREGKFGHAAVFPLVRARQEDDRYVTPVAAMVCNFTKPSGDSPSLLQHDEVTTFFHEFGHVLHNALGHTRFGRFAGTQVERDFVEAPSQIMEHWCWTPHVLQRFAKHHATGEPIPTELVEQLVAARDLHVAKLTLRQVELGKLDLAYHGPDEHDDLVAVHDRVIGDVGFQDPHDGTFFPAGWGHLFGYDAGYYGYLWSKVFGDDMFSRFQEEGELDPGVGMAYRREILEKGGSEDADVLLRSFLGREPSREAFLRNTGI